MRPHRWWEDSRCSEDTKNWNDRDNLKKSEIIDITASRRQFSKRHRWREPASERADSKARMDGMVETLQYGYLHLFTMLPKSDAVSLKRATRAGKLA